MAARIAAGSPEPLDPAIYARVFQDLRDGEMILEDLIRRFARPAVDTGGIDAILKTYKRAGNREVLEFIANRINQANGVPADDD